MSNLRNSSPFDWLVTDIKMPGSRDGLDLVAYARAMTPMIGVVIMSGYAEHLADRLYDIDQPHEFLPKPFNLTELTESIEQVAMPSVSVSSSRSATGCLRV